MLLKTFGKSCTRCTRLFCTTQAPKTTTVTTLNRQESNKCHEHHFGDGFLRNVYDGNNEWLTENVTKDYEEHSADAPHPEVSLLSCCDNRVPISVLGMDFINATFSVRNIGNQYSNSCGSTHFGLDVLQTPYAIIMGHTNCRAIRAAMDSDYNYHHTIVQEIASLVRVIHYADSLANVYKLHSMPHDKKWNVYAEINVDFQINALMGDARLSRSVRNGDLNVIGIMFDINNIYEKGHGHLHVININGETDVNWLKKHNLFLPFGDEEKEIFITRLMEHEPNFGY